jgi:hypothetical protein
MRSFVICIPDIIIIVIVIALIKSRRIKRTSHVARMEEMRNAYKILVGNPEGEVPLGRPRRRWDDNIRMTLGGKMWTPSGSG